LTPAVQGLADVKHKSDPLKEVTKLSDSIVPCLKLLHQLVSLQNQEASREGPHSKQRSLFPREQTDVRLFVANALRDLVLPLGKFLNPHKNDEVRVLCCAIILRIASSSLIGSELLTESLLKNINEVMLHHPESAYWHGVKAR
jgi:hypothetical protein